MEWTDCVGGSVLVDGPPGVFHGSAPEGWQDGSPSLTSGFYLEFWECQRVSWGTFERGPVYAMLEWHGDFNDPDTCHQNAQVNDRRVLESIWFNDTQLADFARSAYNMTAYYADFNLTESFAGPVHIRTWRWSVPGQPESEFVYPSLDQNIRLIGTTVHRLYWDNGPGVSYMDYGETNTADQAETHTAHGKLQPPTLYGRSMPAPDFAWFTGYRYYDASATFDFARFRDNQCTVPY